jgi:hypothetical protein
MSPSAKKPPPIFTARVRMRCPVCNLSTYSLGGAHPQCMQRKNDLLEKQRSLATPAGTREKADRSSGPERTRNHRDQE